jgi:hypothetical protein
VPGCQGFGFCCAPQGHSSHQTCGTFKVRVGFRPPGRGGLSGGRSAEHSMQSLDIYIKPPIDTLLESIEDNLSDHVSFHDILHAYDLLSARIRLKIGIFSISESTSPILTPLRSESTQIFYALRRDIGRILIKPTSNHGTSVSVDLSETGRNEDERQKARDMVLLTHRALRFLSDIFRFPPLQSLFTRMSSRSICSLFVSISRDSWNA